MTSLTGKAAAEMRPSHKALIRTLATVVLLCWVSSSAPQQRQVAKTPNSYAILAMDELTGDYGVAAASHAPLIGMNLEFLDPGAGGVVILGGPALDVNQRTLIALRDGLTPDRAIAVGLYGDEDRERRQIMAVSPGGAAAFSGEDLEGHAAHMTGAHYVAAGHRLSLVLDTEDPLDLDGNAYGAAVTVGGPSWLDVPSR